jgi:hypothetical protein
MLQEKNPFDASDSDGIDTRRNSVSSENDTTADGGGAMMSIFASYYGIEDDNSRRSPGDLIDSAHFDPNAFVKVILGLGLK